MRRSLRIFGFLIAFLQVGAISHADDQVTIVVQEMPGLIEPGQNLPYNRLLNALVRDFTMPVYIDILPGYRGPRRWLRHDYQCIFGGISAPKHQRPHDTVISPDDWSTLQISTPFNLLKVHAFTRAGYEPARNLNALKGQKISVDQVLFFDLRFHTDVLTASDVVKVDTATEGLALLTERRVNHIFAYNNDVALAQMNSNTRFVHDPDFTLLELEESMMCWPGNGVKTFISRINDRLEAIAANKETKNHLPHLR